MYMASAIGVMVVAVLLLSVLTLGLPTRQAQQGEEDSLTTFSVYYLQPTPSVRAGSVPGHRPGVRRQATATATASTKSTTPDDAEMETVGSGKDYWEPPRKTAASTVRTVRPSTAVKSTTSPAPAKKDRAPPISSQAPPPLAPKTPLTTIKNAGSSTITKVETKSTAAAKKSNDRARIGGGSPPSAHGVPEVGVGPRHPAPPSKPNHDEKPTGVQPREFRGDRGQVTGPATVPSPKPKRTVGASPAGLYSSSAEAGGAASGGHRAREPEKKPEGKDGDEAEDDDDDVMDVEEHDLPPRLERGDKEGDHDAEHGVEHGKMSRRRTTSSRGTKSSHGTTSSRGMTSSRRTTPQAPPVTRKTNRPKDTTVHTIGKISSAKATTTTETTTTTTEAETTTPQEAETDGDYDDDRPGIVGALKKDASAHSDRKKALLICTVGSTLTDEAVYPVKERLCDHYVFTHVTVVGSELGTNYGISAYMTFRKMAQENEHRGSVRFGVSLSPQYVESHAEYRPAFGGMMQRLGDEYAVDSFGVMGVRLSHMGMRPGLPATNWISGMSASMENLPVHNYLFVGVVLEAHYPSLRLDGVRQRTLAETLRAQMETLRVNALVLVTHLWDTGALQNSQTCLTQPPSLWMRAASSDDSSKATTPDLETSARILGFFKSNVTRTFLSMTMAVLRYRLEDSHSPPARIMGASCIEGHPTSFTETCSSVVRRGTRGGFDGRSLTPWFAKNGALFAYEDRSSIAAKMKGCLHVLRSLGEQRAGWALFDIEQELLHADDCDLDLVRPAAHGRIRAVRNILDAHGAATGAHRHRRR
ncbi:uncharacterized protein LOC144107380 [Amblyomma americanum]